MPGCLFAAIDILRKFSMGGRGANAFQVEATRLGLTYNGGGLGFFGQLKLASEYTHLLSGFAELVMPQGKRKDSSIPFPCNILEGVYEGCQVSTLQMGSGRNCLGSFFILEHERFFPELVIYPEGKGNFGTDIDLESIEFSEAFVVKSADRRFAYDVCHTRMMEFLLEHRDFCLCFKKNGIALWFRGVSQPETIEPRLQHLVAVHGLLPAHREGEDSDTARRRELSELAPGLRMSMRGWDPATDNPTRSLKQFRFAQNRQWMTILEAEYEDRTYTILDYTPDREEMMEDAPVLNRKLDIAPDIVKGFTYFMCELPRSCPDLMICPESAVTFKFLTRDIEFRDSALASKFSRTFLISCKDEPFARTFCTAPMMEYLLRYSDLSVEVHGNLLAVSVGFLNTVPPDQFGSRLRQLNDVYETIPGEFRAT